MQKFGGPPRVLGFAVLAGPKVFPRPSGNFPTRGGAKGVFPPKRGGGPKGVLFSPGGPQKKFCFFGWGPPRGVHKKNGGTHTKPRGRVFPPGFSIKGPPAPNPERFWKGPGGLPKKVLGKRGQKKKSVKKLFGRFFSPPGGGPPVFGEKKKGKKRFWPPQKNRASPWNLPGRASNCCPHQPMSTCPPCRDPQQTAVGALFTQDLGTFDQVWIIDD